MTIKFTVFCNYEQSLNLMLILMQFLGFGAKRQEGGGLTLKGKIAEAAHFVVKSCLVVPSIWQSFIQIGEMACITPAWSSGKLGLNYYFYSILGVVKIGGP